MKSKYSIIHYSLFVGLIALVSNDADAGVRVGKVSRANASAYNQALQQQYEMVQQPTALNVDDLPVRVANATLADQISRGDSTTNVSVSDLGACAAIYPNGVFEWAQPTAGRGAGGGSTCTSVVEMRVMGQQIAGLPDTGSDLVVARINLAAGDSIKCNISEFPTTSYLDTAGKVVFPADTEPTEQDVIRVMNDEQKQNAGMKIAAGALVAAVAGNFIGKNDVGNDSMFGTSNEKMKVTAGGAVLGAAVMAANSYGGKVAGDVILSTGVNAAAGGVIGNIVATGNSVLRVEKCEIDGIQDTCLWGFYTKTVAYEEKNVDIYYQPNSGRIMTCSADNDKKCVNAYDLIAYSVEEANGVKKKISEIENWNSVNIENKYKLLDDGKEMTGANGGDTDVFVKVVAKKIDGKRIQVMIPGVADTKSGLTESGWREWKKSHGTGIKMYERSNDGRAHGQNLLRSGSEYSLDYFVPLSIDAQDGSFIDFNNKARLGSSIKGAGIGGAMGAFSAYQGAKGDIENRLVTAKMEYKDSLQKVYCATGTRFITEYNGTVIIPNMETKSE